MEEWDIKKLPLCVPMDTLGKIEWEVAAALLIKLWKKKRKIEPVTAEELMTMIKEDWEKYAEFAEKMERKLYQVAQKKLQNAHFIKRFFLKRKKRQVIIVTETRVWVEEWVARILSKEEIKKITEEIKKEIKLPWNPLFQGPFTIIAENVLGSFPQMEEEGLIERRETKKGIIVIPKKKLLQLIFDRYAH